MIFLTVGLSGCETITHDFCVVTEPLQPKDNEVAMYLYEKDIDLTRKILAHNEYGKQNCEW